MCAVVRPNSVVQCSVFILAGLFSICLCLLGRRIAADISLISVVFVVISLHIVQIALLLVNRASGLASEADLIALLQNGFMKALVDYVSPCIPNLRIGVLNISER